MPALLPPLPRSFPSSRRADPGILPVFLPCRCPEGVGTFQLPGSLVLGEESQPGQSGEARTGSPGSAMPRDLGGF